MSNAAQSPVGRPAVEAAGSRADRNEAYRDARAEYARLRALREVSPIAAGTHIPQLPTLQRIAAVLDEELLVCFQRTVEGEVEREFAAVA